MVRVKREHEFPNAVIRIYADGSCREFPKWCPAINVSRARHYVAEALLEKRARGRTTNKEM